MTLGSAPLPTETFDRDERLAALLASLTEDQWRRPLTHPATGAWDIELMAGLYSWHGRHHVAHLGLIK